MDILREKDQVSLGNLNLTPKEKNEDLYGEIFINFMELSPREIQPVSEIPDYLDDTILDYPLIVESHGVYYCIEGWNLVQKAIDEKEETIWCEVSRVSGYSQAELITELGIRKVAVRLVPKGGKAYYAEVIRNIKILFGLMVKSCQNPVFYTHGGDRRSGKFKASREENIRLILAQRLEKSPITISKYLVHAEYLNDDALKQLVEKKADKDFFEKFQIKKRKKLIELKSQGKSEEEIEAEISRLIIQCLENPNLLKETEETEEANLIEAEEKTDLKAGDIPAAKIDEEGEKILNYWQGHSAVAVNELTEDEVRYRIKIISDRISQFSQNRELSIYEVKEKAIANIRELLQILSYIESPNGGEKGWDN